MIREIIVPHQNQLVINIPDNYLNKEIEVIAFPLTKDISELNEGEKNSYLKKFDDLIRLRDKENPTIDKSIDIDKLANEVNSDIF